MHPMQSLVGLVLLVVGTLLLAGLLPPVDLLPAVAGLALVAVVSAGILLRTADSSAA